MRHLLVRSLFASPLLCSFSGIALAQTEATFPLPKDTPPPGDSESTDGVPASERAPTEPAPEPSASPSVAPTTTAPAPIAPALAPQPPTSPNPYGTPPAPPPPVPGNPYGSVAHRPMATPANPYANQQPGAAIEAAPEDETNWSVGGGILWQGGPEYVGTWIGSSSYSRIDNNITTSLLFERRLSPHLHILLQPLLNYRKAGRQRPDDSDNEDATVEDLQMGLEGGLRWVANPGGVVELGMSHVLSLGYNQLILKNAPNLVMPGAGNVDADQFTVGLGNSFIAERKLIPRLWLRMGVGLVGLRYVSTKIIEYVDEVDEVTGEEFESERKSSETALAFGLTPSFGIQLRLTF